MARSGVDVLSESTVQWVCVDVSVHIVQVLYLLYYGFGFSLNSL